MGSETFIEVILALLLPPVGVFLRYGCEVINLNSSNKHQIFLNIYVICVCVCVCVCSLWLISLTSFIWIAENAGGVLDRLVADNIGVHTRNHICSLYVSRII